MNSASHPTASKDTTNAARTFKVLLNTTLGVASVEGITYTLCRVYHGPSEGAGLVMLLSLGLLLLVLPLATFVAGLALSVMVGRIRWFLYGLALIGLQLGFVGVLQWHFIWFTRNAP